MNPFSILKYLATLEKNHPKTVAFARKVAHGGIPIGTLVEITVTKPGEEPISANLKVKQEDADMVAEIKRERKKRKSET